MQIYNVAINPELAQLELGNVMLEFSSHAKERAIERNITLHHTLSLAKGSIVELEAEGRKIKKVIARFKSINNYDDVFVLYHQFGNLYLVLSCYKNHSNDNHKTLKLLNK